MAPLSQQHLNIATNTTIPVTIQATIKLDIEGCIPRQARDAVSEEDWALFADPEKKDLLSVAIRSDLSDSIGTVLSGIQFTSLSYQQLNQLALLVAERGVVFLRKQHFHPDEQVRVFKQLGKIYKGSTTSKYVSASENLSLEQQNEWHADASYESYSPSYSFLNVEDTPEFGGDAAWVSQYGLYDELSAHMKGFLEGLHAIHSSQNQKAQVISHHPAVRTHPVTGLKALNVTPGSVTGFAELKKKESDNLLEFLNHHIRSEAQHSVRWNWEAGCVVIWDNRCTAYRAKPSTYASERTSTRFSLIGERPYFDPASEGREDRIRRLEREEQKMKDEEERLVALKRRYNNTPLRRILSQQVLGMRPNYNFIDEGSKKSKANEIEAPIPAAEKNGHSRVDSVLSVEPSEADSTSDSREQRTALWTNEVHVKLETSEPISVPIKRSNTPLRRILERQVSSPRERSLS